MKLDPVVAEIRAYREAYSERFKGDLWAMMADLQSRQADGGRKVVKLAPKRLAEEQAKHSPRGSITEAAKRH